MMHDHVGWHWGFGLGHWSLGILIWVVVIAIAILAVRSFVSANKQ